MKSHINSLLSGTLLLLLFTISIVQNVNLNEVNLCNQNDNCIQNLIIETKNPELCSQTINPSNCYKTSAYRFKNPKLCNQTQNSTNCIQNIALQTNNITICNFLTKEYFDNCIFQLATKTQNFTYCNQSLNKERCYYSYALTFQNISLCKKTNQYIQLCNKKLQNLFQNSQN